MFEEIYGEASVEVLDILDNMNEEDVRKIPESFIKFLVDNASEDYCVNLDHSKPISELNIKEETKEILGVIYINWWCDKEEQEQYKKKIEEYEIKTQQEIREKYNPNKLFENKLKDNEILIQEDIQNGPTSIIEYKESFFKKIFNTILSFFKK